MARSRQEASEGEHELYHKVRRSTYDAQYQHAPSESSFALPFQYPSTSTSSGPIASTPKSPLEMPKHLPLDSQRGNETEVGSLKPPNKNRKTLNIPRPPNAWICYRSARVHELKNTVQYSKMPQASISKLVGELWRAESPEVKRKYENEAKVKKLEHQAKYPDYSFRPVRRDQPKKSSLKKSDSEPKKRPARLEELPSVLRPGPTTVPSGLPMPIPSSRALDSTSQYSSSLRSEGFHSSSTPSSFPSSPLYSPVSYSTLPIEGPPQALAPIDTSQTWTMFQPNYLPTPPFDANPQAPSPPYYYLPFEQQEYISPGHCMTASSSSSHSFDQNLPPQHELYSLPFVSPLSSSDYHLAQENWRVPEGEASPHSAELSYPNPFYPHS
ncbi:hypothetical protein JCM5350_005605 [Sporobolomyces pararoseus]